MLAVKNNNNKKKKKSNNVYMCLGVCVCVYFLFYRKLSIFKANFACQYPLVVKCPTFRNVCVCVFVGVCLN